MGEVDWNSGAGLRVGVVGAGFIGVVHARAARRAGARLVGVSASTPETSAAAQRRLGVELAFADAEQLIESPEIDVVHICTPNATHRRLAEQALAAGKHVVCEKPLATDAGDALKLVAAAASSGLVATVPFVYRFYPMVREARARVSGAFGDPRLVHGSYLQDWLSTEHDDNWRVDAEAGGRSRAFADIGSHWCDLIEFVTGDRLAAVCADVATAIPERVNAGTHHHAFESTTGQGGAQRAVATEDIAIVMFRTGRGVTGSVVISQISSGHKNQLRFEIAGPDSTLAFDQEQPDTLWIGKRGVSELATREPDVLDPAAAAYVTVPAGHPQGYLDCFDAFVADTYRAIHAGSTDAVDGLPTFSDGARAVTITDAVLDSAASRGWIDVESHDAPATAPKEYRR